MGYWRFASPLQVGDELIFEDMIHYTTVKTQICSTAFTIPRLFASRDGTLETLRTYTYEDYHRMD